MARSDSPGCGKVERRILTFTVDPNVCWSVSGGSLSSTDVLAGLSVQEAGESVIGGRCWSSWLESVRIVDEHTFELVWRGQPPAWEAWLQDAAAVSARSDLPEADCVGPYRPLPGGRW